jgi:hypothetical protein
MLEGRREIVIPYCISAPSINMCVVYLFSLSILGHPALFSAIIFSPADKG